MISLLWNWLKRNISLVLLLTAAVCIALALGDATGGGARSLMMPVSLFAVICGWGLGASRLNPKQAWVSLTALGIPGVFIYVGGLVRPLGRLILSVFSLIPQIVLWLSDEVTIDTGSLIATWTAFTNQLSSVLVRLGGWFVAIFGGKTVLDSAVAGLVWNLLLWLVGAWGGWQLRRNRQALQALAPGGILLALALDYVHNEVELVIVYLAVLLALMGLTRNEWMHTQWRQRKVDYSESIAIDTLGMAGVVSIVLVLSAAGTPSLSWRDLVDKLRESDQSREDRVAESLGLEVPPDVDDGETFRPGGLPRQHLLGLQPDKLQDVVFTVSTGELPPIPETVELHPNRYYWRSSTYDVYTGVGWSSSPTRDAPLPANTPLLEQPRDYRLLNQNIKRASGQNRPVYWTGILAQADVDIEVAWRMTPPLNPSPDRHGDMLGALVDEAEYSVFSYVPQISASQLQAAGSDYPLGITGQYLQLPESVPERVLALAGELTRAAPTAYERALAIETYLRAFPYTLEVESPPFGRDVSDYFLFTAQQGYCDYYATTMVVLARAAGLPARLVVGYASGDYDPPTAKYIVRREHAHSWVEIYFSGIGWTEFEPTAGQPAIVRPEEDASASESGPDLPSSEQASLLAKIVWLDLFSSLAGQAVVAGMGLILAIFLWQMGERWLLHLAPSHWVISRIYSRMEKASARLLPDLPEGHTPHQLGSALIKRLGEADGRLPKAMLSKVEGEIGHVVALHVAQVFSQHPPTKSQINRGIRYWARLRLRLWLATRWLRF
jgi:transglutaminase-like putative cysteine protease